MIWRAMVFINGLMEGFSRELGRVTKCMAKELYNGLMGANIQGYSGILYLRNTRMI